MTDLLRKYIRQACHDELNPKGAYKWPRLSFEPAPTVSCVAQYLVACEFDGLNFSEDVLIIEQQRVLRYDIWD